MTRPYRPPALLSMLLLTCTLGEGCTDRVSLEDARMRIKELCVEYCPRRLECVDDDWADGDVDECVRRCTDWKSDDHDRECTDFLVARMECIAALKCEDLPEAALVSERDSDDYPCSEYSDPEQEFCQ